MIEVATAEHAHELALDMRAGDQAELATQDETPLSGILSSLESSTAAFTLMLHGRPAAMFGVGPVQEGNPFVGIAWLLTSNRIDESLSNQKTFMKACRVCLPILFDYFPSLFAAIDARYAASIRWAQAMGFDLHRAVETGPHRMPFVAITMQREKWDSLQRR